MRVERHTLTTWVVDRNAYRQKFHGSIPIERRCSDHIIIFVLVSSLIILRLSDSFRYTYLNFVYLFFQFINCNCLIFNTFPLQGRSINPRLLIQHSFPGIWAYLKSCTIHSVTDIQAVPCALYDSSTRKIFSWRILPFYQKSIFLFLISVHIQESEVTQPYSWIVFIAPHRPKKA